MFNRLTKIKELNPQNTYSYCDKGNGELFADVYKNLCRYNVTSREWFVFDGKIWVEDTGGMLVSRYAKELADTLLIYVTTIQEETKKKAYLDHVAKLGQLRYKNTMLLDARF